MSSGQNPAVDFDVDEVCRRFLVIYVIYTGAISEVLDEMGYHNQVLPKAIQGLTMDQKIAGLLPLSNACRCGGAPETRLLWPANSDWGSCDSPLG
jgi:hypothetical protein